MRLLQELLIFEKFLLQSFLASIKFPAERRKMFPVLLQVGKTGFGLIIIRRVVDQPYLGKNFFFSRFLESLSSFPDNKYGVAGGRIEPILLLPVHCPRVTLLTQIFVRDVVLVQPHTDDMLPD